MCLRDVKPSALRWMVLVRFGLQVSRYVVFVFEGKKMTATLEGEFVDVWEKVP